MTAPVAVVGTGVIGGAWAALFLARGHVVHAHDPADGALERLIGIVREAWPSLVALGADAEPPLERIVWCDQLENAVREARFVQESGPEQLDLKQALVSRIDALAPAAALIATSSSGLRPTDVQAACDRHPERVLVGHPFHPAHLIPLVEVVGGEQTSPEAVQAALDFYTANGKRPIHVRAELAGHVVNRLQAALWREAYSLVQRRVVTVGEIDSAIAHGPGLRWAVIGPFAGQHLSGGEGGISQTLEHLGPPMVRWWAELGTPEWDEALVARVVEQTDDEFGGITTAAASAARDRMVLRILAAKADETDLPS